MLVLERRQGERVIVPVARLEIEVLEIRGSLVRIGFRAPQTVDIYRAEIWARMAFDAVAEQEEEGDQ